MRNPITRSAAFFVTGGFVAAFFLSGAAYGLTGTVFQYSTPKTGYFGLSPMAFAPDSQASADAYNIAWPDGGNAITGTGHCFNTGVNLPQGARMSASAAWYTGTGNLIVILYRSKVADGTFDLVASINANVASATRKVISHSIANSAVAIVDNQQYVYSVGVCLQSGNVQYDAGRITYTYTNAGD
jgi:hypothetical protein